MLDVALFAAGLLLAGVHGHLQLRALRVAHERERRDWTMERGVLLNRIKPETAQLADTDDVQPVEVVSEFSDEEYWQARGVDWKPEPAD